jgi:hypothetical protein
MVCNINMVEKGWLIAHAQKRKRKKERKASGLS